MGREEISLFQELYKEAGIDRQRIEEARKCLQERLGEQKIAIVVARDPDAAIERIARRDGVEL